MQASDQAKLSSRNANDLSHLLDVLARDVVVGICSQFEEGTNRWNLARAVKGKELRVPEGCKERFASQRERYAILKDYRDKVIVHHERGQSWLKIWQLHNTTEEDVEKLILAVEDCFSELFDTYYEKHVADQFIEHSNCDFGKNLARGFLGR